MNDRGRPRSPGAASSVLRGRTDSFGANDNDTRCESIWIMWRPPAGANEFAAGKSQSPPSRRLRGLGVPTTCGVPDTGAAATGSYPRDVSSRGPATPHLPFAQPVAGPRDLLSATWRADAAARTALAAATSPPEPGAVEAWDDEQRRPLPSVGAASLVPRAWRGLCPGGCCSRRSCAGLPRRRSGYGEQILRPCDHSSAP